MPAYNVNITVTYRTNVTVGAEDADEAYYEVERMIKNGEIDLDLSKDLDEYDIDEDFVDITEELRADEILSELKEAGRL